MQVNISDIEIEGAPIAYRAWLGDWLVGEGASAEDAIEDAKRVLDEAGVELEEDE